MKKRLCLLLSITLVLTFALPLQSFAQYDEQLENAIKKAKTLFNISDEYDKFDYSINKRGDVTYYYLSWHDSDEEFGNINVTIDSDGFVQNYYSYIPQTQNYESKLPKISKTDGLKIAKAFIEKVAPELADKLEYQESNAPLNVNDRNYHYDFVRVENEVPYYNNNIYISVNNVTGQVKNYGCNWDKSLVFPDKNDILSLEEAKEAFKDKISLELVYRLDYTTEEVKPFLVYTMLDSNEVIDAKTGEVINNRLNIIYERDLSKTDEMIRNFNIELSPEEFEAIENAKGIISEVQAEEFSREFLDISKEYKLNNIYLYNDWNNKDDYIWSLYFQEDSKENPSSASISLDAKTKEVISLYKYTPYSKDEKVKYDKEEALEIANKFLKSIQKDRYDQIEYIDDNQPIYTPLENEEMPRQISFNFIRKTNDAYFIGDGFNIGVNTVTGEIYQYNSMWYEGELPDTDNTILKDKAYDIFFNDIGYELKYIDHYNSNGYIYDENNKEIKLVYAPKTEKPLNIDAYSGEILYDYGRTYKEDTITTYNDIDDSYAKMQIEILAEYGISLQGTDFMPKQIIKQKDFLYLLAKAKNSYFDRYDNDEEQVENLYDYLTSMGIVKNDEKSPEATVTKQDAVKFIVRALGYDKVANIQGIFKVDFKDAAQISPELLGYVAIAEGLNIVNGSDGNFNPNSNLTREQSAVLIYNFLNIE